VADVHEIETAVGKDNAMPLRAMPSDHADKVVPLEDLVLHGDILPSTEIKS
jgi:hypothetical protein